MRANRDRNETIRRLRREGVGPREIARRLDVSPNIVAGVLHRAGMATAASGRGHGATGEVKEMARRMIHRGETWAATAAAFGVTQQALSLWGCAREPRRTEPGQ